MRSLTLGALIVAAALSAPIAEDAMAGANSTETATLGGGCFWCLEAVFAELEGVEEVVSGYAGGEEVDPSYRQVCEGETGHAEVVRVRFDPERLSYRDLLMVFFGTHDPTTRDRQGADVGSQYRSIILHHDEAQRAEAEALIREINRADVYRDPIVTELAPFTSFYAAEDYHQDYYARNPRQGYCQVVIAPKLDKFRKQFAEKLKK